MANTSATQTLYFESTAGLAKFGKSGQTNQLLPLTGSGNSYLHGTGAVTLYSVTAAGSASQNPTGSGAIKLPSVLASGICGALGAVTLPSVTIAGSITNLDIARGALTLPRVKASGHALSGYLLHGDLRLPSVKASGFTGWAGAVKLTHVSASGTGRTDLHATGYIRLPSVHASGVGHLFADAWRGALVLPSLRIVPRMFGALLLPSVRASGNASSAALTAALRSWAFNVEHKTVTEFPAYFFVRFLRWNNHHYGIGINGGLYLLEGENDAGVAIPWLFRTGQDDMGSPAQKGVSGVYVTGNIEAGAELTLIDDKKQRYTYRTHAPSAGSDQRVYRVVTGKGIRTCGVGIEMASTLGGYFEVDLIAPKFVVSKRNL